MFAYLFLTYKHCLLLHFKLPIVFYQCKWTYTYTFTANWSAVFLNFANENKQKRFISTWLSCIFWTYGYSKYVFTLTFVHEYWVIVKMVTYVWYFDFYCRMIAHDGDWNNQAVILLSEFHFDVFITLKFQKY